MRSMQSAVKLAGIVSDNSETFHSCIPRRCIRPTRVERAFPSSEIPLPTTHTNASYPRTVFLPLVCFW